jgi:hypothetical protein
MRIAAHAADLMTTDAQLLPCPIVTARARRWIATRFTAVEVLGDTEPTRRMWAAPIRPRNRALGVTRDAAIGLMTCRARAGLGLRFERVTRRETCAMHARRERIGEVERRRQGGDSFAMAARTELLAMTGLTDFARGGRAYTVLAHPVAIVGEVGLGQRPRLFEVLVACAALACVARRLLVVTLEASRHRRSQVAIAFRNTDVTTHAVAARWLDVAIVIKSQMLARLGELCERAWFGMTTQTRPTVVWLCMT